MRQLKKDYGVDEIFLEVRPTNSSAIKLYEKLGFENISVRKKYYSDGEDAMVFKLRIGSDEFI